MRVINKREKGTFTATIGKTIGEIWECVSSPENQRNCVKVTDPVVFLCHEEEYKENVDEIKTALAVEGKISLEDPKMEIKPCLL